MSAPLSFVAPTPWVFDRNGQRLESFTYPGCVAKPEETLPDQISTLMAHPSLGITFSKFTDGRGFSLAARLRESGYAGELHAMGEVNQELLFLLSRVGFTHFHLPHDTPNLALQVVRPFAAFYQGAADGSVPVWQMLQEPATEGQTAEGQTAEGQTAEGRTLFQRAETVAHGAFA